MKLNKQEIKLFESNFLDGDKIDDCGKAIFSVGGVLDVLSFFKEYFIGTTEFKYGYGWKINIKKK